MSHHSLAELVSHARRLLVHKAVEDHPIIRLADRLEPKLRQAFLQAIQNIHDQVALDDLAIAYLSGHVTQMEVEAQLNQLSNLGEAVDPIIRQGFLLGSQQAMDAIAGADIGLSLSLVNPAAVSYAQEQAAELVTLTNEAARDAIRQVVAAGLQRGDDPYTVARLIRSIVGLNGPQGEAVTNFYDRQSELVDQGEITAEQALNRTERYSAAKMRERADMIARTEAITSLNHGQQALWEQAKTHGHLNPDVTFRQWIISQDEITCEAICLPMDGVEVGLDEPFILPDGSETMVPGADAHPNCRCTVGLTFHGDDVTSLFP